MVENKMCPEGQRYCSKRKKCVPMSKKGESHTKADVLLALTEEFAQGFKGSFGEAKVYRNPSLAEMKEIGKDAKFIAMSPSKTIYMWKSPIAPTEVNMALGLKSSPKMDVWGRAKKKGKAYMMAGSESIQFDLNKAEVQKLADMDWSWAEKYVKGLGQFVSNTAMVKR